MAAILARLADLRARREASAARPPAVPPELAAAAAAVGSPTRGTWDADYIQQLRCGEDSRRVSRLELDSEEDEVVVLPPPQVRLDPVAQRAAWRKQMMHDAKQARRAIMVEKTSCELAESEIVLEQLTEEPEEVDEQGEHRDYEEGDVHDDESNESDGGEQCEDNNEDSAVEEEEEEAEAKPLGDLREVEGEHCEHPAVKGGESNDIKDDCGSQERVPLHAANDRDENELDGENDVRDSHSGPLSALSAESRARDIDLRGPSNLKHARLIDDEAEEEGEGVTGSSDEEDDDLIEQSLAEDPEDPEHPDASASGALFHQQWQAQNDLTIIRALAERGRGPEEKFRLENDNAIDVLDGTERQDEPELVTTGAPATAGDVSSLYPDTDADKVEEM
jgi:hypothetical protein